MAKGEPSKAQILLTQADSYAGLILIGFIFSPIFSIIFYNRFCAKINEANLYKLTPAEKDQSEKLQKNAKISVAFITALWMIIIGIAFFTLQYQWQKQREIEQTNYLFNKYR